MECLRVADLDGDGWPEVISGVDTNHRQLIVYRRDGEILWDADMGGAVTCVESEGGKVFAGAANGFVQCFTRKGARVWSRFLAEPVAGIAPVSKSRCLAALRGGRVVALDAKGAITEVGDGKAIASATWARGAGLAIGRKDGGVACYA